MNSKVKDSGEQGEIRWLLRQNVDYKLGLNLSLAGLSWPLFIGGQVPRNRSGEYKLVLYKMYYNTISYFDYDYALIFILGFSFHRLLPEQTSGILMPWALVFIPLSAVNKALLWNANEMIGIS
jgi:hypothetical protein